MIKNTHYVANFHQYLRRLVGIAALITSGLFSSSVEAVIAVDAVSTAFNDGAPLNLTVAHTTAAGTDRLMIVGVSFSNRDAETVTSVTYNGVGLSFVGQIQRNNRARVELWSYLNPPAISANVIVNFNDPVQRGAGVGVITLTGVDQATPFGAFQSNNARSTVASMIAISAPGETVLGVMAADQQDNNPAVVGGTPQWTYKTNPAANNRTAGAGATFTGSASVNLTWNLNEPDDWVIGAISLRESVPPSGGFCDDFESGLGNWTINAISGNAGINGDTFNSAGNSLFTRWGVVQVTTTNTVGALGTPYLLSVWIRRGSDAFSEFPEGGDNLQVQYFNNLNNWITLETFAGGGAEGEVFERSYALPADAQHNGLRVRFVQTGGSGNDFDYWHIDDLCLLQEIQPQIEFRMDELLWDGSANEVVDSSGNGNDANANAASGLTTIDPGQICRAGDFDGVDDYIESNDIFAILRGTASLSFWIRTTQTGNDTAWLAPGVTGAEQSGGADDIFWGWLDASGRIGITVANDYSTKSTVAINDGNYHHVVLTRDSSSGDYKIYIDGTLDQSGLLASGVIGTSFSSIGRIEDTGGTPEYFEGDLDELSIFNTVLTDSAVAAIYLNQSNGRNLDGSSRGCLDALSWFQLDADAGVWNGTVGEVVDQSGNFNAAFALGTGAGVDSVTAQVCRGIDIPANTSVAAQYGFDSGIDIDDDVGNRGTISFWYKSDGSWAGGADRALFDASPDSLSAQDKIFLLMLRADGALQFALEDSVDDNFIFASAVQSFAANLWVHVAVTWDMNASRQIYINGTLAATDATGTTGSLGELDSVYFGDNRSSYHFSGTPNSADGVIDEVRLYDRVQSQAEITTDMNATHACAAGTLDHFAITPNMISASTCLANTVTIVAEDASNNPLTGYSGTVDITTSTANGNWSINAADNTTVPNPHTADDGNVSYTFLASDMGEIELDLSNTHAQTLRITVSDSGLGVNSTSVDIIFASNLFVITDDAIRVAGRDMAMSVAMWTDDTAASGSCGPDPNYDYNSIGLDVRIDRGSVLTAALDPNLINSLNASPGVTIAETDTNINFDFSSGTGSADFTLDTSDVGQYRIVITDNSTTHSPDPITGQSALLTVRPFGLAIEPVEAGPVATPITNPGGTNPSDSVFVAAGSDFRATVAGVLWDSADDTEGGVGDGIIDSGQSFNDNMVAPSYAWNTALSAAVTGFTPAAGSVGSLNNGNLLEAEFMSGSFTVADLQYTEVGSFTLQARANDYLGVTGLNLVSDDIIVGRFIPASFDLNIGSINHGSFQNTCPPFTYLGQDFGYDTVPTFTVNARNALGAVTSQYRDTFVKLNGNSVSVVVTQDDSQIGIDSNPLVVSYSAAAMMGAAPQNDGSVDFTFGADSFRYGPTGMGAFTKFANSRVAPFTADINPEVTTISDGEVTTNFVSGTYLLNPTGNSLRFGRLRMNNVHGSELNSLQMPVFTEFWNGTGFERNTLDFCSVISADDLGSVANPVSLPLPSIVNATASGGTIDLNYPSPGAGITGYIDTNTDLGSASHVWLRDDWDLDGEFDNDPSARATFGIFEGNPVQIYLKQTYE